MIVLLDESFDLNRLHTDPSTGIISKVGQRRYSKTGGIRDLGTGDLGMGDGGWEKPRDCVAGVGLG
jgi:hypothetical protein